MADYQHWEESLVAPIIRQAQQKLMSPRKFHALCQQVIKSTGQKKLYFYPPPSELLDVTNGITIKELRQFLDKLAKYVSSTSSEGHRVTLYLKRVRLRLGRVNKTVVLVKKTRVCQHTPKSVVEAKPSRKKLEVNSKGLYAKAMLSQDLPSQDLPTQPAPIHPEMLSTGGMKVEVEIAGAGMVGRVARLRINGKDLAFKAFFDPDFVWQHGPWAEIPIGIRLKYAQVTKNCAEFLFASQDWMVSEWIYPDTNPEFRHNGITYEQFAEQEGLTQLNSLNIYNYNPYNIRLDPGGIQKEYWGRRWQDFLRGIVFYLRKVQREGLKSLTPYLSKRMITYLFRRLIVLISPWKSGSIGGREKR
ncbi:MULTISPECIES: hypothetical protein [unclassified Moorena]|uniref:hypothetical protein n=1 Tax=unclassified Moorena TaxID=2683338 RepID=UPI0025FAD3A3|nr:MULTISPECIES: hypothetical protein [unclassified Moorena]